MNLRLFSLSLFIMLLVVLVITSGCQKEVIETTPPPADEAFTGNSSVSTLIQRIALRDGSVDNIIDKASCISIVLPVTVVANGIEVVIESEQDYNLIEQLFDEYDDDEDNINIMFPIVVIFADHTQLSVTSEDQFEDIIDECTEGMEDDDIECIDFRYPLELALYDSDNQKSEVVTINNDEELVAFVELLDDSDYVGFNFPITLVLSNGVEVQVFDNKELEDVIEDAIDDCDEDDDNDYNDNDIDDTELQALLSGSSWRISYFFTTTNLTNEFEGFLFTFNADGSATLGNGLTTFAGSWESSGDAGILQIELDFEEVDLLDQLDDHWKVIQFTDTEIELESLEEEDGVISKLTLQKA